MDQISSLFAGHVAGKLIDRIGASFRTHVIERWSKRRAQVFFAQFCDEVAVELSGAQSDSLEELLSEMLKDEACSELLFDSYRRVSLSRSKTLGPRVIGILSAQLALERRDPTVPEEVMMDACERLTDKELLDFAAFIDEHRQRARNLDHEDDESSDMGRLELEWAKEEIDSNWNRDFDVSIAPLNLNECLGAWATKLRDLGILSDDVKERKWDYEEDSERHVDEPGSIREISWWIYISDAYLRFAELIDRVSPNRQTQRDHVTNAEPPTAP